MADETLITLFVRPLDALGIPYMVTGGVASSAYGDPRTARDIDLVIDLQPADSHRFVDAWPPAEYLVPSVEVIEERSSRPSRGQFTMIHRRTAMRAEVYLAGTDALNAWAFPRAVVRRIDDVDVRIAPIESVILTKLRYFQSGRSDRHLHDIHRMLRTSSVIVDRSALERWAGRLGVDEEWSRALKAWVVLP